MRRLAAVFLVGLLLASVRADEREERLDAGHVKVGQTYRFKLAASNESVWEVVSRSDEEVRYRIRLTVAGKELASKDEAHVFPLRRKVEGKEATGEKETVKVSGIEFPCTILETESGGTTVRTWRSTKFPEIVKVQLGKDVTSELVSIDGPR